MSYGVSCFYEAFYFWCEIGVVNFSVASWYVFFGYFSDNCVELCGDCVDVVYVGGV